MSEAKNRRIQTIIDITGRIDEEYKRWEQTRYMDINTTKLLAALFSRVLQLETELALKDGLELPISPSEIIKNDIVFLKKKPSKIGTIVDIDSHPYHNSRGKYMVSFKGKIEFHEAASLCKINV
ncbi:hypothetical protein Q7X36_001896 [Listeria monocytogenes]|nr:hypothetical protein [Listeria monocytogenes]